MNEKEYFKVEIPKEDYDALARLAEQQGKTVDEMANEAVIEGLKLLHGKTTGNLEAKELLDKYYEAKAKNPRLGFADFLEQDSKYHL